MKSHGEGIWACLVEQVHMDSSRVREHSQLLTKIGYSVIKVSDSFRELNRFHLQSIVIILHVSLIDEEHA